MEDVMASILNNVGSIFAQRNLAGAQRGLNSTINRLSTGLRINKASDDAAGLQISNNLRADIKIINQGRRNANDGIGRIAVADGVLEEATNLLTRAATLSEQAASGTTTTAGRTALNAEFTEIKAALDDLDTNTKFDGVAVFGNSFDITAEEMSVSIAGVDTAAADLGITGDLTSSANAATALGQITSAIETVSSNRGTLGAKEQRLNTIVNSLGILSENVTAAESQIRDADIAAEVVNLTKFQILSQTGVSALAQANQSSQSVLSLLG
jgi:flagellin